MIPLIGTATLPALSALVGILIIFLFVTVPDWYKRHNEIKNEREKSSSNENNDKSNTKSKVKSKPGIDGSLVLSISSRSS